MKKLMVLLTLYAAVAVTVLLLRKDDEASKAGTPAGTPGAQDGRYEDLRVVMAEARKQARTELKSKVKDVDLRLARIETLRKTMDAGLVSIQAAAEGAAQGSYDKLEELDRELRGLKKDIALLQILTKRLTTIQRQVRDFEGRIDALEKRPVHAPVVPTPTRPGAQPTPPPKEPERPGLPPEPQKDPDSVRAEIEKARRDILSEDLDVLFPAIEKVREHRVMDAVPRLLQILAHYKDEFGRTAAAAALGRMEVCDAVPGLAEALVDKSALVAQQANKAITQITKMEVRLSANARIRERRAARSRVKEWWREHEDEVRTRLGQPRQ